MRLDHLTAELRPRETWEASDFGARLVRRDAGKIYFLWFAITLPLLVLALLATWLTPYYTSIILVYWWLEPIADGPILHVIARRLFGEEISRMDALRATLRLAWQNKLFLLTPFRFHAARSVAMPVTQLEGLRGMERRKRSAVINNHAFRHGFGLTIVYQHVATAIYLGMIILGFAFIPAEHQRSLGGDWLSMFDSDAGPIGASLGLVYLYIAQSSLQPWFVGAGFGLYINCRTRLEAWDLEVAFRRMVARRAGRQLAAAAVCALLAVSGVMPDISFARQGDAQTRNDMSGSAEAAADVRIADPGFAGFWAEEQLRPAIETITADPRLDPYREIERWVRIDDGSAAEVAVDAGPSPFWIMLQAIGKMVATMIEFGLWIGLALLLVILFATRDRWLPYLRPGPRRPLQRRRVLLAGGEVTEESLPDDIPLAVRRLWSKGQQREAMALLYRASVFSAVRLHGVRLPKSATEGDCLKAVAAQSGELQSAFFRRMTDAWLCCAYAARGPAASLVDQLCSEWPAIYREQT